MLFVSFNSNTTGATSGAGTANPFYTQEFIPGFKYGSCNTIFSFRFNVLQIVASPFVLFSFGHCVVCLSIYGFCLHFRYHQTLLVLLNVLVIVWNVLFPFTVSDYPFAIFNHFVRYMTLYYQCEPVKFKRSSDGVV